MCKHAAAQREGGAHDLSKTSAADLLSMKEDLEARLARFQRAFHEKYGRSPNEAECAPAKPAMRWYKSVCKELCAREQSATRGKHDGASRDAAQQHGDFDRVHAALTHQAQVAPPAARKKKRWKLSHFFPGPAMLELIINWAQYLQLFAAMLGEGAEISEKDVSSTASWTTDFQEAMSYFAIFNIDFDTVASQIQSYSWTIDLDWRRKHVGLTIAVPLAMGIITVLLIKSLDEIIVLCLLTIGVLAVMFGIIGSVLLNSRTNDTPIFVTNENMQWLSFAGLTLLIVAVICYFVRYVKTLRLVRRLLEDEVWNLQTKLAESADAIQAGDVQEAQLHAEDIASMLPDRDAFIGGSANSASEALEQLQNAKRAKEGRDHIIERPKLSTFIKTNLAWAGVTLIACILWLDYLEHLPADWEVIPVSSGVMQMLAIIFTVFSVLILLYQLITLSPRGQLFLLHAKYKFKSVYVGLLVIASSSLYIPVTRQALTVFMCFQRDCDAGSWYPLSSPSDSFSLSSYISTTSGACQSCEFLSGPTTDLSAATSTCPSQTQQQLCAAVSTRRLQDSPDLSCDEQWPYLIPSSVMTLLCFSLGTLWLYHELVAQHTKRYASLIIEEEDHRDTRTRKSHRARFLPGGLRQRVAKFKQGALAEWDEMEEEEQNEAWVRRVRPSKRNKARTLYCDFKYRWRGWKVTLLWQKLLIVLVVTMQRAHGYPVATALSFGAIHCVMFVVNMFAHPYLDVRADFLSISISLSNVFNSIVAALALNGLEMQHSWINIIYAINFAVPPAAVCVGWLVKQRQARARAALGKRVGEPEDTPTMAKQRLLIERNINEYTLRLLVSWTSAIVFCSCFAAELIFIGQFEGLILSPVWTHASPDLVPSTTATCAVESRMRTLEFAGYNNWSQFVSSCCCMARTAEAQAPWSLTNGSMVLNSTLASSDPLVELWMCQNSSSTVYKERQRHINYISHREFCGTFFVDTSGSPIAEYEPYWDSVESRFVVDFYYPNGSLSETILDYW